MSIIVFCGPSLALDEAKPILSADYRPPAKQGDVYLACKDKPKVIAIIDGYFESTPSVWHKEILYAMSLGIHVYGSSSMGALRAAELSMYGMQGAGEVYAQFAQGALEDDDEVAITHAPAALNYQTISVAMVNIRATLKLACRENIIDGQLAQVLTEQAKMTWYPERNFDALLSHAATLMPTKQYDLLADFIRCHAVDVKRDDALALLQQLAKLTADFGGGVNIPPCQVDFAFIKTDAWAQLTQQQEQRYFDEHCQVDMAALKALLAADGRLDELKTQANARQLCLKKAQSRQVAATSEQMRQTLIALARQHDCIESGQVNFDKLSQWFDGQQLTPTSFDRLMQQQSMVRAGTEQSNNLDSEILDILRLNGELSMYLTRMHAPSVNPDGRK